MFSLFSSSFGPVAARFALVILLGALSMAPQAARAQGPGAAVNEPAEIDLTPWFDRWNLTIKNQHQRDTCAVFTVTAALEFGMSKRLDEGVPLSEEYLNWAANDANGDEEDGATFTQLQQGFSKWGIAGEDEMAYRARFDASNFPSQNALGNARQVWQTKPKWNWIARLTVPGLSTANIAAAKRVLQRGWPVCAGGEHCMLLVAFYDNWEGGGTFLARDYARQSYETLTYAEVQRRFDSMLWIEFTPATANKPAP